MFTKIVKLAGGLFVSGMLLLSCRSTEVKGFNGQRIEINGSEVKDSTQASILASVKLVPLETTPGSVLSEVNKIVQFGDKFILQDKFVSSVVAAFDSRGKFLFRYGSKGEGRGQHILPMDFTIDKKSRELLVVNSERRILNYYDVNNGNFKRLWKYSFPVRQLHKFDDGSFVFAGAGRDSRIIFSDSNMIRRKSFVGYTERYALGLINDLLPISDTVLTLRLSYNDTIYRLTPNNVEPYLVIDFGDRRLTDSAYNSLSAPQRRRLADYTEEKMTNIGMYAENAQTRVFTFNHKRKVYVCVQDKTSGRKQVFRSDLFHDELLPTSGFPTIVGVDEEGNFLCVISAEKILDKKDEIKELIKKGVLKNDMKEFDILTPLSNPILAKLKFKNF